MANRVSKELQKKLAAISESNLSIYSSLDGRPELFLKLKELEEALSNKLVGLSLHGLPIRTRSKVFKTAVCEGLGYLAPLNFRKTRPRFPGQDFDTYVQKANNLQIWNEEISPTRRYVLARCDPTDVITKVRVITGEALAEYDRTGTLTKKYQARRKAGRSGSKLISERDTDTFRRILVPTADLPDSILRSISPTDTPIKGRVLAIRSIYDRLTKLVGDTIESHGSDQERNRGIGLQRLVCPILGLKEYADKGQFPDVLSQALEVKLQTSPTIDLGLVSPDGTEPAQEVGPGIRHCDVRYAVFYGRYKERDTVELSGVVVTTGQDFFGEFDSLGER